MITSKFAAPPGSHSRTSVSDAAARGKDASPATAVTLIIPCYNEAESLPQLVAGIGPVLEAEDVMAVLAGEPRAPVDLREKSLRLAAHLLEYDPALRGGAGYARARDLLESGAALKQMHRIMDAQGPSDCNSDLGQLTFDVKAPADGIVSGIDCLQMNRLARTAGAPLDKGAGIRLFKKIGDPVEQGQPLYRVYTFDQPEYALAGASAEADSGYTITAPKPHRAKL